jgi:hypothetical protein
MRSTNTGTPTIDVMIPTGTITPVTSSFAASDAVTSRHEPLNSDAGRKWRWSSPTSIRATCGPTRPMKPIVPASATAVAANRDTPTRVRMRTRRTRTPRAWARASPRRSAVSVHDARANSGMTIARTEASTAIWGQLARPRLPSVQNTTCCSWASLATYCISDSNALNRNTSAMPNRITVSGFAPRARPNVTITAQASMANTHAVPAIPSTEPSGSAVTPTTTLIAAPNPAAADTPSV